LAVETNFGIGQQKGREKETPKKSELEVSIGNKINSKREKAFTHS
jgi:hypothetical protein